MMSMCGEGKDWVRSSTLCCLVPAIAMEEMDVLPLELVSAHMYVDLAACQLVFAIVNMRNDLIEDVPQIVSFICLVADFLFLRCMSQLGPFNVINVNCGCKSSNLMEEEVLGSCHSQK
jgi:hypothetical protein